MSEIWRLTITAVHLLENLATDLYGSAADCLAEILRNGLCACMPQGKWLPKLGHVEIHLVDNHPLAPKCKSLVILDHGGGFTEEAIKLYSTIGRAVGDAGTGHSGAAQKRIGRFAAFALNRRCMEDRDISTGFFILTRTSADGPVTMVSMIPEKIEKQGGQIIAEKISVTSSELGPQKGIKGSFTAIVIPHSVFNTYDEIRQALFWRVPRKKDLMYRLEIGGKQIAPPALADKVSIVQQDGRIEAYIDRIKERDDPDGGIWFTDSDTGIRVASARAIGQQRLPYPLWKPDLVGDIFIPGLLANQDTSRSGLSPRYLASPAWKKATTYLIGQVVPKAKALLGDDDVFGRDMASKSILSFVEQCAKIWGSPESAKGGSTLFEDGGSRHRPGSNGNGRKTPPVKAPGSRGPQLNPNIKGKTRVMPVRIGNKTFVLNKQPMDSRSFAEVDTSNGQVIYINDGTYVAMPTTREARDEHILLKLFEAAGQAEYPDDVTAVKYFVAERRQDFLKSK